MATNEELQHELAELREEMRQMRAVMAAVRVDAPSEPKLMSRRNLLRAAPVVAVGGAIAAMSAGPAAAAVGDPVLQGKVNAAGAGKVTELTGGTPSFPGDSDPTWVPADSAAALSLDGGLSTDWVDAIGVTIGVQNDDGTFLVVQPAFGATVASFTGVPINDVHYAGTGDGIVVSVEGATAIYAHASSGSHESETLFGVGVSATTDIGTGVDATAADGQDQFGAPVGGVALSGTATTGSAVLATATSGHAISASTTSATTSVDAVTIDYAGKSRALYAESTSTTNINGTITGVNAGNGIGVWGEQRGTGAGFGLVGVAGKAGRGAQLTGGAAQVRLVPAAASTHPTTGKTGDLFVDASARLWYCQKASSGSTAATWKQLA